MKRNKILCVKLRKLGDTALWTSSLRALRVFCPEDEIHVLVTKFVSDLLMHFPGIDCLHVQKSASPFDTFLSMLRLRKYKFDYLLGFHATPSLIRFSRLLHAEYVIMNHHSLDYVRKFEKRSRFFFQPIEFIHRSNDQDAVERDYEVIRAMGKREGLFYANNVESFTYEPTSLYVTSEEIDDVMRQNKLPYQQPTIALIPGASGFTRRYPEDLWKSFVVALYQSTILERIHGHVLIIVDAALSKKWRMREFFNECQHLKKNKHLKPNMYLLNNLTLRQMMAVLKTSSFAIGNDSGPTHIARALGVATLTLFGPGCFGDWHPKIYRKKIDGQQSPTAIRVPVPCRIHGDKGTEFEYCSKKFCSHLSCMRNISQKEILNTLDSLILMMGNNKGNPIEF